MFIRDYYTLPSTFKQDLQGVPVPWGFGPFSETIFYTRYSRVKPDGTNETWAEAVCRVIEGMFSILKTYTRLAQQKWDEKYWDNLAIRAATSMFNLKWSPPGRGMWAQGTEFVYERGSDALNNCAFVDVTDLAQDAAWLMDKLMKGVGVGFSTHNYSSTIREPRESDDVPYRIPDSREGWVESVRRLIRAYTSVEGRLPTFDYSGIRRAGAPIKGFGGISAGYKPLERLHQQLREVLDKAARGEIPHTRLVADVMNLIGVCVIAGNVRRSAEIALGKPDDITFLNLKNYGTFDKDWNVIHPGPAYDRMGWGHMSNNSIVLENSKDFQVIGDLFPLIANNGEPGIVNMQAIQKYGRTGEYKVDTATGINPCGEVPLESYETCNLSIIYPTRCKTQEERDEATTFATLYSIAVSLLPSDEPLTQRVVSRNHRIGVGVSGLADWSDGNGSEDAIRLHLYRMYQIVSNHAKHWSDFFGINTPIRLTTVKPDGTASLLAGVSPGMHWPWAPYSLRRVRQAANSAVSERLIAMGVPHEPDVTDPSGTLVFEFPIAYNQGKTRAQSEVSAVEQLRALRNYQEAWADNSVSATITFRKDEVDELRDALSRTIDDIKSVSFLPAQDETQSYQQAPFEAISKEEHDARLEKISSLNWGGFRNSGPEKMVDLYCDSEVCTI